MPAVPAEELALWPVRSVDDALVWDLERFVVTAQRMRLHDSLAWSRLAARWRWTITTMRRHHALQAALLWPWLCRDVPDMEPMTRRVEQEQTDLVRAARRCSEHLDVLVRTPDEGLRAALVVRLVATRDAAVRLRDGDQQVLLARAVDRRGGTDRQPVEGLMLQGLGIRRLAWALEVLPRHVRADVLASAGPVTRLRWRVGRIGRSRGDSRMFADDQKA